MGFLSAPICQESKRLVKSDSSASRVRAQKVSRSSARPPRLATSVVKYGQVCAKSLYPSGEHSECSWYWRIKPAHTPATARSSTLQGFNITEQEACYKRIS